MYKNVFAACRWVCTNILGLHNTATFYETSLHITHALMTQDYNFSMQHQLFRSICSIKAKLDKDDTIKIPLPCLITQICRHFMTLEEFSAYDHLQIRVPIEHISRRYTNTNPKDWTPRVEQAHVLSAEMSRLNEKDFWNQPAPDDEQHFREMTWEALKRLNTRLERVEEVQGSGSRPRRQCDRRRG